MGVKDAAALAYGASLDRNCEQSDMDEFQASGGVIDELKQDGTNSSIDSDPGIQRCIITIW